MTLNKALFTLWSAKSYLPDSEAQEKFQKALDFVETGLRGRSSA